MPRTITDRQKIRDDHSDSWIAVNEGDSIYGPVVDVTEAWSDQRRDPVTGKPGSYYPLLIVEAREAEGYEDLPRELKVHCFGTVLFNEIMRKQPGIGEEVTITYKGTGEAKSGQNPPELYTVRAGKGAATAQRAYDAIAKSNRLDGLVSRENQPIPVPQTLEEAADAAADDIPF